MSGDPLTGGSWRDRASLTLPEVSAITGIPLRSLQDGCRAGTIRSSKQGRTRVMKPEWVDQLLESRAPKTREQTEANELNAFKAKVSARLARSKARRGAAA